MFNSIEKANQAFKMVGILFVILCAMIYHLYETQKWPFDGQVLEQRLEMVTQKAFDLQLEKQRKEAENASLQAELATMQAQLNQAQVAIMLADTIQDVVNANVVMAQELELTKRHSAEVISLVKAQKAELVKTVDGIYSKDDKRDHELARDMVDVSKEYAKKSGLCCGKEKKPKPTVNQFEFLFEGLTPTPQTEQEQSQELPFIGPTQEKI